MDATTVAEILAKPIAQELLFSDIPARLSYIGLDGDPRVVPVGFWWTGETFGVATVVRSAKVAALRKNPRVALAIGARPARALAVAATVAARRQAAIADTHLIGAVATGTVAVLGAGAAVAQAAIGATVARAAGVQAGSQDQWGQPREHGFSR